MWRAIVIVVAMVLLAVNVEGSDVLIGIASSTSLNQELPARP